MLKEARDGNLTTRSEAKTAYLVRVARLAAGKRLDEPSVLEDCGAILECEYQFEVHLLRVHYEQVHKE